MQEQKSTIADIIIQTSVTPNEQAIENVNAHSLSSKFFGENCYLEALYFYSRGLLPRLGKAQVGLRSMR